VRAKTCFWIGVLGAVLASAHAQAQTLTADFTIEKPTPCVDGACVVVVKALGTGSATNASDTSLNEREDLVYAWNFGNPNNPAPNWRYGSRPGTSKNTHCCGHWFAHFYDGDVGTVTITLRVSDVKNGLVATAQKTVQIVAQNAQWPGTNTLCVNAAGDSNFAGCPSGAQTHNIGESGYADWDDAVRTTMATPNRILFKCGSTYAANATLNLSLPNGPKLVGGYGAAGVGSASCNGTSDTGTYLINNSTANHSPMLYGQTVRNLTIRDMTMAGRGWKNGAGDGLDMIGNPYMDVVMYHDRWRDTGIMQFFENGTQLATNQGRGWVVENDNIDNATATNGCYPGIANTTHAGGYNQSDCQWGTQLACSNCGILGTHFGQIGSHTVRSSKGFYRLLAYSTIDGATTSDPRAYVKWNSAHAACGGAGNDSCWPDCRDHDDYIGWNFINEKANPHPPVLGTSHTPGTYIALTPQTAGDAVDAYGTEEITQAIVEGNYADLTGAAGGGTQCFRVVAHDSVVRNNVCNFANRNDGDALIESQGRGSGALYPANATCAPAQVGQNLKYLNNTAYTSRSPQTGSIRINVDPGHANTKVQNNLLWGPALGTYEFVGAPTGNGNVVDHNLKLSGGTSPFAGGNTFNSMQDFRLVTTNTTARRLGTAVEEARPDADMMCRAETTPPDVGAFDSGAIDCGTGTRPPAALEPPQLIQP
jgi:hypothetical protein